MNQSWSVKEESNKLKPGDAIREHCRSCVCGTGQFDYAEVEGCTGDQCFLGPCPLFPYRLGDRTRGRLKAMRAECLMCMGGSFLFVEECDTEDCSLHPYRFGTNPALVGKRGPGRKFGRESQ